MVGTRLAAAQPRRSLVRGTRVMIDARPMQEPERSPLTAEYLSQLLATFARERLDGESFVVISRALRDDPTKRRELEALPVAGHRTLPPTTRVLRSAGLTLDSFLLRGAEFGAADAASSGAVFHTAGGAVPIASRLPIVATLLDLAPWELPQIYATSAAARLGHRLRARVLHDATRVIVCARATAETARRALRLPADRLAVIPLAVDEAFRSAGRDPGTVAEARDRFSLPPRYVCFSGRYDARKDMRTLFEAIRTVRAREAHDATLLFVIDAAATEDARLIGEAIARHELQHAVRLVATSAATERAAVIAGADAFVYPALSEATAWHALEALSLGVPVICTRAGALPETCGSAGIVVAPRDPIRLAAAIEAVWDGGALAEQLRRQARRRADSWSRSWSDVAQETREVYADAALASPTGRR